MKCPICLFQVCSCIACDRKAISKPKGPLEMVEKDISEPGPHQVRKVQACGICHGDSITKEGLFPGIEYPRIPGHEIAWVIDSVGEGVDEWKVK